MPSDPAPPPSPRTPPSRPRRSRARRVVAGVGILVALAAGGAGIYVASYEPAQRPASPEPVEPTALRVARGEYLVKHVLACNDCHAERDWGRFAGPMTSWPGSGGGCLGPEAGMPGRVCLPNITQDPETGIGAWSDGEIMRAIREGVSRDGRALFPMMPYASYRALSDEDTRSVVSYLRTTSPRKNRVPPTEVDFPVSFFIKQVPRPVEGPVPEPDRTDAVESGRYLAVVAGCVECHTPVDDKKRPIAAMELAGGKEFSGPWGTVRSPNLTPHESGLAGLTKEQFIGRFKAFAAEGAAAPVAAGENTVMPWLSYAGMTREDLGVIWAYLKTVAPKDNRVVVRPP